jgi:hypothetical protein
MKRSLKSYRSRRRGDRNGATLIDVATGSMLLAVLLIPSMRLISDSQSSSRRLHNRDTALFEAEQLIESTKVALAEPTAFDAALLTPIDATSTVTVSDGPDLTSRVRVAADASLPTAKLLSIVVDVWIDTDGDSRLDTSELSETLRTQWAGP